MQTGEPFAFAPQPLLATGKVRYVGEPVALIVAETRAQALDAAERDRHRLETSLPVRRGMRRRSPTKYRTMSAWTGIGGCRGRRCGIRHSRPRRVTAAEQPPHRHQSDGAAWGRRHLRWPLHATCIQPESCTGTAMQRRARWAAAADVRFIAPDVGGGFGAKNFNYAGVRTDPVGGKANWPAGEVDRDAQRRLRLRSSGA